MRTKRFVRFLSDEDAADMEIQIDAGRVAGFCLNYRARIGTVWHEVIRYDTAHGWPHVHRFWRRAAAEPWPGPPAPTLEAAYNWAKRDIDANWQRYRIQIEVNLQ